jgi:hypothetical protein
MTSSGTCKDAPPNPIGPRIAIPVCACILRGAGWTVDPKQPTAPLSSDLPFVHNENSSITSKVTALIVQTSSQIWEPQANIALVPELDATGEIPVLDFPSFDKTKPYGNASIRDGLDLAQQCRQANWGRALAPGGLVVIIVRKITDIDGTEVRLSGYSADLFAVEGRRQDLCTVPRHLTQDDETGRYTILEDPAILGLTGTAGQGLPYIIFGHELGHDFLLDHGDGLDNDGNGTQPGTSGPRLFDLGCDLNEYNTIDFPNENILNKPTSLMRTTAGVYSNLTPLQIELARTAAPLIPGAVMGH